MRAAISAERLRELLEYDPVSGLFTRRTFASSNALAGSAAGGLNNEGYVIIHVAGTRAFAHRLAFLYQTGAWPSGVVDHVDGNRANNAWSNLRDVSPALNQRNRVKASKNSKTGVLGVYVYRGKFMSALKLTFGPFDTAEEASAAYHAAKRLYHPMPK
jgi:hypothetical protein